MKNVTVQLTLPTSLDPGAVFHALADKLQGDHRFDDALECKAFFAEDPKGQESADAADGMRRVRGSVEATHVLDDNRLPMKSIGFSGRRKLDPTATPAEVSIRMENRPGAEPFACLEVNGFHVWRFDSKSAAELVASNLKRGLRTTEANR